MDTIGALCLAGVAALALGCKDGGGGNEGALPGQKKTSAAAEAPKGDGSLTGAGATFPYPLYTKWISEFSRVQPAAGHRSEGSAAARRLRRLRAPLLSRHSLSATRLSHHRDASDASISQERKDANQDQPGERKSERVAHVGGGGRREV